MKGVKWRFQTSEFHCIPLNLKRGVLRWNEWSYFLLITTNWHDSIVNYENVTVSNRIFSSRFILTQVHVVRETSLLTVRLWRLHEFYWVNFFSSVSFLKSQLYSQKGQLVLKITTVLLRGKSAVFYQSRDWNKSNKLKMTFKRSTVLTLKTVLLFLLE